MKQIKNYMLFGLIGFSLAGFIGTSRQIHKNVLSFIFSTSTIYYCLTLFISFAPILIIVKFLKTKSFEGILGTVGNSMLYSFITLGTMLSVSNISYLIGGSINVLLFIILTMYIASLVSMKLVENLKEDNESLQ